MHKCRVGGPYQSLMQVDLCEVWQRQPPRWRVTGVKFEASLRSRVKPRRILFERGQVGPSHDKVRQGAAEGDDVWMRGTASKLSLDRTHWGQDSPRGQAPMGRCRQDFWGTCSAIHRESARPIPSSATLTNHERSSQIYFQQLK